MNRCTLSQDVFLRMRDFVTFAELFIAMNLLSHRLCLSKYMSLSCYGDYFYSYECSFFPYIVDSPECY